MDNLDRGNLVPRSNKEPEKEAVVSCVVTVTSVTIKMSPEPGNKVNLTTKWTENGWRRSPNELKNVGDVVYLLGWNNSLHFDAKLYKCCLLLCKISDRN